MAVTELASPPRVRRSKQGLVSFETRIGELREHVEAFRISLASKQDRARRSALGQFFTPWDVGRQMAAMFGPSPQNVELLDPGAGIGGLTAAFVVQALDSTSRPNTIRVTCCEIDPGLLDGLKHTLDLCTRTCAEAGVDFQAEILAKDFLETGVDWTGYSLFEKTRSFNRIVMNPPYKKIHSDSKARALLRRQGVETTNLYSGFLAVALKLLTRDGELVAITPRSFCNGPYFLPLRRMLLDRVTLRQIHLFESRKHAFASDEVLQENVILAVSAGMSSGPVLLTTSAGPDSAALSLQLRPEELVHPGDVQLFIRLPTSDVEQEITRQMGLLPCSLGDLGLEVSTGKVVDFRSREHLRLEAEASAVPLYYPQHIGEGRTCWPSAATRKPERILSRAETSSLLLPKGNYVLTKRLTAKEEKRRVVAALLREEEISTPLFGIENHLNFFHRGGRGMDLASAGGLTVYLRSSFVDRFFRQFNGHTQVNATDLRSLRYPSAQQLRKLGYRLDRLLGDQVKIDERVSEVLFESAVA